MKIIRKFLMMSVYLQVIYSYAENPIPQAGPGSGIKVFVHNMCEYWSRVYVSDGVDSLGSHASIGFIPCYPLASTFIHTDSLLPLSKVKYFDLFQSAYGTHDTNIMCLGNEDIIFTYKISYPTGYWCDSTLLRSSYLLLSDSIADAKVFSDMIVVIRKTDLTSNFVVYDSSFSTILFSQQLNMVPEKLSINYSECSILGKNQNNATALLIIDLINFTIRKDTILSPVYLDPFAFISWSNYTLLLTQPGDTAVHLLKYNWYDSTFIDTVIHSGSGIQTFFWEGPQIHFQPKHDTSGAGLDKNVIVFNFYTMQQRGIFSINKHLRLLSFPGDVGGYFPYAFAIPDSGQDDKYYLYDLYNYTLLDSGYTAPNAVFFKADFRCPVKVSEYDDAFVKWQTFPNPTNNYINLSASGLICGRDYKVDIVNSYGTLMYAETIHAKMTLTLPVETFSPGIYFIRIHTLKGLVVQKFVKT